jgi:hypothetical protein
LSPEAEEDVVGSRYQATTSEDTAGWEILSVVLYSVEIAIVLLLFVVTTCKWSINPIINPKPRP